jgi:membrane-bound lytic murein transglycosylase A
LPTLPGWPDERFGEALGVLGQGCRKLAGPTAAACAALKRVPAGDEAAARALVSTTFDAGSRLRVQVTGYWEMELPGSRTAQGPFRWPVLRRPANPALFDRAQIAAGALGGLGLETVWLASAADAFFLQLQGTGRIRLPDGSSMRVGGQAHNGRRVMPTTEIFAGVAIVNRDYSIGNLRAWCARNPDEAARRILRDPSYHFMSERSQSPNEGPLGSLGVPLTPLRSLAANPDLLPAGSVVWFDGVMTANGRRLSRVMQVQDSGAAIPAGTIDLFFGTGDAAEAIGGRQYSSATLWLLLPRRG